MVTKKNIPWQQKSADTRKENTTLKYYAFLLKFYSACHKKAIYIQNQTEYCNKEKINSLTIPALADMHLIIITQAKSKEGFQNEKTGKMIRWIGDRPTEDMSRSLIDWMAEKFRISVINKKERDKVKAKEVEKLIEEKQKELDQEKQKLKEAAEKIAKIEPAKTQAQIDFDMAEMRKKILAEDAKELLHMISMISINVRNLEIQIAEISPMIKELYSLLK